MGCRPHPGPSAAVNTWPSDLASKSASRFDPALIAWASFNEGQAPAALRAGGAVKEQPPRVDTSHNSEYASCADLHRWLYSTAPQEVRERRKARVACSSPPPGRSPPRSLWLPNSLAGTSASAALTTLTLTSSGWPDPAVKPTEAVEGKRLASLRVSSHRTPLALFYTSRICVGLEAHNLTRSPSLLAQIGTAAEYGSSHVRRGGTDQGG